MYIIMNVKSKPVLTGNDVCGRRCSAMFLWRIRGRRFALYHLEQRRRVLVVGQDKGLPLVIGLNLGSQRQLPFAEPPPVHAELDHGEWVVGRTSLADCFPRITSPKPHVGRQN